MTASCGFQNKHPGRLAQPSTFFEAQHVSEAPANEQLHQNTTSWGIVARLNCDAMAFLIAWDQGAHQLHYRRWLEYLRADSA